MKLILALAIGVLSASAHAEVVTYTFSGIFDAPSASPWSPRATPSGPLLFGLVSQGDHFSGQFTFDTSAPARDVHIQPIAPADWAYYPAQSLQFKATDAFNQVVPQWKDPSRPEDGPAVMVTVERNSFGKPDSDPTTSYNSLVVSGVSKQDATYTWNLDLVFRSVNPTFDYPSLPDGYHDFIGQPFQLQLVNNITGGQESVSGTLQIQYAGVSPVPEPSSALMLLAGLAGVGGAAAFKRRRA